MTGVSKLETTCVCVHAQWLPHCQSSTLYCKVIPGWYWTATVPTKPNRLASSLLSQSGFLLNQLFLIEYHQPFWLVTVEPAIFTPFADELLGSWSWALTFSILPQLPPPLEFKLVTKIQALFLSFLSNLIWLPLSS